MNLTQWIKKYDAKAPEPFVRDKRYNFYFRPDKGFCELGMTKNMIIMHQLCGDARYWRDVVNDLAHKLGIKHCGTICIRKGIKAYIRLFGYQIEREEKLSDGLSRYHCLHKKNKTKALVSPSFKYKNSDIQAYFVTWEVK